MRPLSTGLYSSGAIARELGVTVRTIINAVNREELRPVSNGLPREKQGQYRFTSQEAERFVAWYRGKTR